MFRIKASLGGQVLEARVVRGLPFTIGRSFENDLVIDHDTVSSAHAHVERREDGLYLKDLGSTNGLMLRGRRIESVRLEPGLEVHAGEVQLAFDFEPNERRLTTRLDRGMVEQFRARSRTAYHLTVTILTVAALLIITLAQQLVGQLLHYAPLDIHAILTGAIAGAAVAAFGGATLSAFSMTQSRRWNLPALVLLVAATLALIEVGGAVLAPLWYHLPWPAAHALLPWVLLYVLLGGASYLLARIVWPAAPRRRTAVIMLTGWLLVFGFLQGMQYVMTARKATSTRLGLAYPVAAPVFGSIGVDELMERLSGLERSLGSGPLTVGEPETAHDGK